MHNLSTAFATQAALDELAAQYDIFIGRDEDESLDDYRDRLVEEFRDKINELHDVICEIRNIEIDDDDADDDTQVADVST